MRRFYKKAAVFFLLIFPLAGAFTLPEPDYSDPDFQFWFGMLGKEEPEALDILGSDYTGIQPELLGSSAETILWFHNGLTIWISRGRVTQLRFDSSRKGEIAGLSIGSPKTEVIDVCGNPWIESDDSLYYNLPWRGGPARMRFIFTAEGGQSRLKEVYLYLVR